MCRDSYLCAEIATCAQSYSISTQRDSYICAEIAVFLLNMSDINFLRTAPHNPAQSNVFLNDVRVQFFDKVKYLGVWINASLKDDDDIQRQVKHSDTFDQCSPAAKVTLYFVPIACQWMLANRGANIYRLVWSAYMLRIAMSTELCITDTTQNLKCSPTPG